MSDHEHHYPDPVPSDGYEKLDANLAPLLKFLVWLGVSTAAILVAMWALLEAYKKMPRPEATNELHPLAVERQIPLDPRLEALKAPHVDVHGHMVSQEGGPYFNTQMWKFWQAKWQENLSTYGWIDPSGKVVRVPIERAMQLKLAEGFPASPNKPRN